MEYTHEPYGPYERWFKRPLDIVCSVAAMTVFCWLYAGVAILVRVKLGSPVIFKQPRPGKIDPRTGKEKIFTLYKFRTMTDERDEDGNLLPDDVRLTPFGRALRASSLDELPEALCILKGDMSVVGPRPQLVRDMVFMTPEQRRRHTVRPGLSGLAQVRGRNAISWEGKLSTDLEYIQKITFLGDLKIILATVKSVLKREGVTMEGMETAMDYGDVLLAEGKVTKDEYDRKQAEAKELLRKATSGR